MKQESKTDNYVFDLIDALQSPILTHDTSWADVIPTRIRKIIPIARMAALIKHEEFATYAEVCAFMMSRVMLSPLTGEWYEIYMHVSCTVCEKWFQENHWEELEAKRELSMYEQTQFLLPLRNFIYQKRRMYLKQKMKSGEEAPQCPIVKVIPRGKLEYSQLQILFT
jgi:hypothetical protein